MKNEFYYMSGDGVTKIHAIEWLPEGEMKGVLQICHGMVEYIDRYDEFARYLAARGYYVVGHDHLGHGQSIQSEDDLGFFHETQGNKFVLSDIHQLRQKTQHKYPDIPYFILGHSMGSFLARQYIQMYGSGLQGAIIMGTGHHPAALLWVAKGLCKFIAFRKGWHYRSKFINSMAFGSYNRKFQPANTQVDWVTSDPDQLAKYVADPLCSFTFTINGYYHLFCSIMELTKKKNANKIPKDLPVFFVAGQDDPVGNFGKSVEKVYNMYRTCGIKDLCIKLYQGDRHEILNETDRQQVYADLHEWLEEKILP